MRIWSNLKKIYINFLREKYLLLEPMVNFQLKIPQSWVCYQRETLDLASAKFSFPRISDDKPQIWAILGGN